MIPTLLTLSHRSLYADDIMHNLISTADAAKLIGASKPTILRLCRKHLTSAARIGNAIVLTPDDVETLRGLYQGRVGNPLFWTEKNPNPNAVKKVAKKKAAKKTR